MSPEGGILPVIFLIGFIGMFVGREVGVHQAVEYAMTKHFYRTAIIIVALIVAYAALYSSGFFYAINSSGDAAQQRLEASKPAQALDDEIAMTRERLSNLAGFANAERAHQEQQRALAEQQSLQQQKTQLTIDLAAAREKLNSCPKNYYTICINPTNELIATLEARLSALQIPTITNGYASRHAEYTGLQQHLTDLQKQRAELSASGHGVQSAWKSEDRFLSWLLGITPEEANSIKWLVLTFIFDLLSLLFRIIASLTLHNASAVMIAQRKFNALISAGFSLPEIIKMLGSDSELMQAMSTASNPANQPTKASTAKSEPLHTYHDGGRVREVEVDANGEQHAVLRKNESVLNEGATNFVDTHAEGLIDKLNAAFSSTPTQKSNEPVPATDLDQAPESNSCVTMQEALHNMRNKQPTQCVDDTQSVNNAMRKNVGQTYNCQHCGKPYKARTVWQKYCSEACRLAGNGVKDKGQMLRNKRKKQAKSLG